MQIYPYLKFVNAEVNFYAANRDKQEVKQGLLSLFIFNRLH